MSKYKHIVIVHFEIPLGSAVIAIATLRSLKESCPNLKVTVIASGHSHNLLAASPYVDNIIHAPNPIKSPLTSFFYAITKILPRKTYYDAIILDYGNSRTLITIFAFLTGIKKRIGYSVRPWLVHVPVCDKGPASNIEKNNKAFIGIVPSALKVVEPSIFFYPKDVDMFNNLFKGFSESRPRVVFVTETSKGHPNAWFADRFAQLGRSLIDHHNALIMLVGTASNRAEIDSIIEQIGSDAFSLAGQTSPRQLAALMAASDFCISVDTGAMHIARGVALPTVIIGNAAQPVSLWLPPTDLDYFELIRKDHLSCSICWKLHCSTRECMDEITVQEVVLAFCRLKERVPWGHFSRELRIREHTN
jgi:heptosyltransferase-3